MLHTIIIDFIMLLYLTGKQLNKAGHCEEESDHEPTVSKGKITMGP